MWGLKSWARALAIGVVFLLSLCGAMAAVVGCGGDGAPTTTMVGDGSEGSTTEMGDIFTDLARAVAPMPVYGVSDLPAGVTVPVEWWPVVDCETLSEYEGPVVPNPRVSDSGGADPEIQLLLSHGDGWLMVVENFRGDLGDVSGERVGTIGGGAATLYEVNGGSLVQWSDGGRWYGVFGRGVSQEIVVEIALEMRLVDAPDTQ